MAQAQPYLFYSKRCPNSAKVLDVIKGLNRGALFKFIEVETLTRENIAGLPFKLAQVPTLYNPTTKEAYVGNAIFGAMSKPVSSRTDIPSKPMGNTNVDGPSDLMAWGFEGTGKLSESYSSWQQPTMPTSDGNSLYTYLGPMAQGQLSPGNAPESANTLDKGSSDDVKRKLEQIQKQRDSEFSQITRK